MVSTATALLHRTFTGYGKVNMYNEGIGSSFRS